MVGIISAPLGGCVPATYYSCSQFWLAFHFLLDNRHPRVIGKDTSSQFLSGYLFSKADLFPVIHASITCRLTAASLTPTKAPSLACLEAGSKRLQLGCLAPSMPGWRWLWVVKPRKVLRLAYLHGGLLSSAKQLLSIRSSIPADTPSLQEKEPPAVPWGGRHLCKSLSFFSPWGPHVCCLQATLQSSPLRAWEEARSPCPLQHRLRFVFCIGFFFLLSGMWK